MNWTIHRKHFSQMTGVLDLMHALSYAYRAAAVLEMTRTPTAASPNGSGKAQSSGSSTN